MLDTNVVSEGIKPEPHPSVLAWLDLQTAETLFLSSISVAELLFGFGALPDGRRKDMLAAARRAGKGFPTPHGYIAAVAAAHGFAVASRDTSAFTVASLTVLDPWTATR